MKHLEATEQEPSCVYNNKNKSFVNTVEAIVDIWENQVDELQNIKYNTFKQRVGIDPKTVRKFLGDPHI